MGLFGKNRTLYTLVSNARVVFAEPSPGDGLKFLDSYDLEEFLRGDLPAHLRNQYRHYHNHLLVVPDFWVGVRPFLIASGKRAFVDQFVARKLRDENPELADVGHFFDYTRFKDEQGREGVQVYYLIDPLSPALYRILATSGLRPARVTSPGLIWQQKMAGGVAELPVGGTFLIDPAGAECFFYLFYRGQYLFSRDISFSELLPVDEWLDALAFEIDQSCFLFTQKTKAYIDRFLLVSSGRAGVDAAALEKRIGKAVADFDVVPWGVPSESAEELNVLRHFSFHELSGAGRKINLAHRQDREELEWRLVQNVALASGICLLLLLAAQALFLQFWTPVEWRMAEGKPQAEQRQLLRKYNNDIDLLLQEAKRPRVTESLAGLSRAMPDNVRLESFSLAFEPVPQVTLSGQVNAADAGQLRATLVTLVSNLKAQFAGSDPPAADQVEIGAVEETAPDRFGPYRARMNFKLP